MIGRDMPRSTSGASRLQASAEWRLADFLLGGLAFLPLGQQIVPVVRGMQDDSLATAANLLHIAHTRSAPGLHQAGVSYGSTGRPPLATGRPPKRVAAGAHARDDQLATFRSREATGNSSGRAAILGPHP